MAVAEEFYYNDQLRNYIVQFAAVFQGTQVELGRNETEDKRLAYVPVKNASSDRVVAAIKGDNTQNKMLRLPMMAFQLTGIEMAPERRVGIGSIRRNAYTPLGGLVPNDTRVVEQRMPVPYNALFELTIWASNQDQHYQILEQILSLFDPILQIQTNDDVFDWTKITTIELLDIRFDENIAPGVERRSIQTTLSFVVPIYLSVKAEEHNRIVQDIYARIGAISGDVVNAYDALADLDSQGIEYSLLATSKGIPPI